MEFVSFSRGYFFRDLWINFTSVKRNVTELWLFERCTTSTFELFSIFSLRFYSSVNIYRRNTRPHPPKLLSLSLLCLYPDILWFEKCFFGPEILQKNWNFCFATLTYRVWKCTGFTIPNTYVRFLVTDKELRKWTNYEKPLNNRWRYLEDRWFTLQNYNYSKMQIIACNGRWKYFYWRERIYRNGFGQSNDESR